MELVFVSHPLHSEGTPEENFRLAEKRCQEILDEGKLPISPLHVFSYVELETPELRKEIMEVCFKLIRLCSVVYMYGHKGGCLDEKLFAYMIGKPVIDKTGGRK